MFPTIYGVLSQVEDGGPVIPPITYDFKDYFTTSEPVTNPRTAVPGPGQASVGSNVVSLGVISGGQLTVTGSTGSAIAGQYHHNKARDLGVVYYNQADLSGVNHFYYGLGDFTNTNRYGQFYMVNTGTITIRQRGDLVPGADPAIESWTAGLYHLARVETGRDGLYFIKGSSFPNWTLIWLGVEPRSQTRTTYGMSSWPYHTGNAIQVAAVGTMPSLLTSWADRCVIGYGDGTAFLDNAIDLNTVTHTADFMARIRIQYVPNAGDFMYFYFRQVTPGATGGWRLTVEGSGTRNLTLDEWVTSSWVTRSTAAGVTDSNTDIYVLAQGDEYAVKVNSSQVISYTSTGYQSTETRGMNSEPGSGNISSIECIILGVANQADGLDVDMLAGVLVGDTFTTPPGPPSSDFILELTPSNYPSSADTLIKFNVQDGLNYWSLNLASGGTVSLVETIAGTPITRISPTAHTAGGRMKLVADGSDMVLYGPSSLLGTYGSATNFRDETAGEVDLSAGCVVSWLVVKKRRPSGDVLVHLTELENLDT